MEIVGVVEGTRAGHENGRAGRVEDGVCERERGNVEGLGVWVGEAVHLGDSIMVEGTGRIDPKTYVEEA